MGLGRALAEMMVKAGADVTIVARGQERLDETERVLKVGSRPSCGTLVANGLLIKPPS